jgi:hypothetical protein
MQHIGKSTAAIAAAALTLALAGSSLTTPASAEGGIKCAGINACKGHSECQTASSSCNGLNSCKGKGWVSTHTAKECKAKGGKVIE